MRCFSGYFTIRESIISTQAYSPLKLTSFRKYSIYKTTIDEWTTILRLAHQWLCDGIRNLVFRELNKVPVHPVTHVALVNEYDAPPEWREKAYFKLGRSKVRLTEEDIERLGLDTVLRVAQLQLRERFQTRRRLPHRYGYRHSPPASVR